jgi:WD40 repeat protein
VRHEDKALSAKFSPDGKRVLTASEDMTAQNWDAETSKPLGACCAIMALSWARGIQRAC